METLSFIAAVSGGEVVFDYGEPLAAFAKGEARARQVARARRVAAVGEPWITRFAPAELAAALRSLGFDALEDLGPAQISRRFYGVERRDGPGGHLMHATRLDLGR